MILHRLAQHGSDGDAQSELSPTYSRPTIHGLIASDSTAHVKVSNPPLDVRAKTRASIDRESQCIVK